MEEYLGMKGVFSIPEQQNGGKGWDNTELGDLLYQMIDEEYKVAEKKEVVDYPSYLPLKVQIVGHEYSGRKMIVQFMKEKYGLVVIDCNEMIKSALDYVEPTEEQQESNTKLNKGGNKQQQKENETVDEELRELSIKIKEYQKENREYDYGIYEQIVDYRMKKEFRLVEEKEWIEELIENRNKMEEQNQTMLQ